MSGPGYYRFRCKNFYTYNCENWVWVNNSPCAACVAEGRESMEGNYEETIYCTSNNINVPLIGDGCIVYGVTVENVADSSLYRNLEVPNDILSATTAFHIQPHPFPSKEMGSHGRSDLNMHD